jgi:predicted  nucleic acid-binding Zn-ribbon protein
MLDEVRALLILQDRDRRLMAINREIANLPKEEARAKAKLAGDEAALTTARDALRQAELQVKKIEMDAETRRTTIKRLKLQQFETRKNDEYQALGHEVTRYEKELDGLETQALEAMEEVDGFRQRLREAETAYRSTQTLIADDLAQLAERQARLEANRAELMTEREALAAKAPEELLPLYERLMRTKDGMAIAPMHDGRCGGCHMRLIASTAIKVQAETEVTRCEDCGRILYQD